MTNLTSGVAGAARTDPSTPQAEIDPGKVLFNGCNYEHTEAFMDISSSGRMQNVLALKFNMTMMCDRSSEAGWKISCEELVTFSFLVFTQPGSNLRTLRNAD